MAAKGPVGGFKDLELHRLVANYWALPLVALFIAPVVAALVLWIDAQGAGRWLHERGLALFTSAETAQDAAAALIGVNAAFLTLYWSVVLIILTLATGNLGVRLVDRWLDKQMVRRSMAALTFCLVFSVVVFTRVDIELPIAEVPHFALAVLLLLGAVAVAILGVAIHDLGRTMFVDRSIAHLGREAQIVAVRVTPAAPYGGEWTHAIAAPRAGYIQSIDLAHAAKALDRHPGKVRFCAAPGHFVLEGEPLVLFENRPPEDKPVLSAIPIGEYRSSVQSTVYQVRLLVEVAARALSQGINDFYTALACADQIAAAISGHAGTWVDDGQVAVDAENLRFELPGQDFRGLFEGPLKALRQSASSHPAVTIRMIENYARLAELLATRECPSGLLAFLEKQACDLRDQCLNRADYAPDREDIESAFARFARPASGSTSTRAGRAG